jgi:hypothetical protein
MHACRHCGQENQNDSGLCTACGLELSPSLLHRRASQAWERIVGFVCRRPVSVFRKIALPAAGLCVIVGFSAFHARRICDEAIGAEGLPPPRYNTRFAIYPDHLMEAAAKVGFNPGWVITYAAPSREYGTAYYVDFFGRMRSKGTPNIVIRRHEQDDADMEKFRAWFAHLDAAVTVGNTFSNVVSVLGDQYVAFTNSDGSFSAYFQWMPRSMPPRRMATNGFSLKVSNDIVVWKDYSFLGL